MDRIVAFARQYWDALIMMTAEMAPYLLLGFFFAGLLRAFMPKDIYRRHLAPKTMKSVVKAAVERAIREVAGVSDVRVDLSKGVAYVEGTHNPDELIGKVSQIGYPTTIHNG